MCEGCLTNFSSAPHVGHLDFVPLLRHSGLRDQSGCTSNSVRPCIVRVAPAMSSGTNSTLYVVLDQFGKESTTRPCQPCLTTLWPRRMSCVAWTGARVCRDMMTSLGADSDAHCIAGAHRNLEKFQGLCAAQAS